jgi:DNA polymerase elongation subunit (family B)
VWDSKQDDTKLIKDFIQVIKQADEIVAHNGDKFDMKELRTRAILTDNLMFPVYRTLDTLKKARQYFRFPSNKLDYLGKALNLGRKLDHEGMQMWIDICEHKSKEALDKMVEYCEQDVILLEDVYHAISPYIYHNTNFAVLKGGHKWHCPECASDNVQLSHTDATAMGVIRRHMKCNDCRKFFKISNRTYLHMLENLIRNSK